LDADPFFWPNEEKDIMIKIAREAILVVKTVDMALMYLYNIGENVLKQIQ
jgi:hypothetical protein